MAQCPDSPGQYASAPCFAHELVESGDGFIAVDEQTRQDVMRWRRAERDRLLKARLQFSVAERRAMTTQIAASLDRHLAAVASPIVSVYWPMQGEPDLRPWMHQLAERGVTVVLPVVESKGEAMVFRQWTPQARLIPGIWNIPVPADGMKMVPNIMLSPVVGFDKRCFRLGYGGGYFDRTLAAMVSRPEVIGVGYSCASIPTIFPLPHDIPMDLIVTESAQNIVREIR